MAGEIGLSIWLSMNSDQQKSYLHKTEQEHIKELQKLSYDETLKQTHQLLRLVEWFPSYNRDDNPVGLGVIIGRKKI